MPCVVDMVSESTTPDTGRSKRRSRRRKTGDHQPGQHVPRDIDYRHLRNPFPAINVFSDDRIEAMHVAAYEALESLGIKVLLPQARQLFRSGGATVDEKNQMVYIGRDMVEAALASAPTSITCRAATRNKDVTLEPGAVVFQPAAGAPHATDLIRGRRPGCARDLRVCARSS